MEKQNICNETRRKKSNQSNCLLQKNMSWVISLFECITKKNDRRILVGCLFTYWFPSTVLEININKMIGSFTWTYVGKIKRFSNAHVNKSSSIICKRLICCKCAGLSLTFIVKKNPINCIMHCNVDWVLT